MASRSTKIRHLFAGGWATDFGPTTDAQVDGEHVRIPFLSHAENVFYGLDGGPYKIGGAAKLNSSAVSSGAKAQVVRQQDEECCTLEHRFMPTMMIVHFLKYSREKKMIQSRLIQLLTIC